MHYHTCLFSISFVSISPSNLVSRPIAELGRHLARLPPPQATPNVAAVDTLLGVRVQVDESTSTPRVEYLVKWKDDAPSTWEPATNLAPDLLREFETQWWNCCRKGDADTMRKLLSGGKSVLARTVDENGRTGLHFVAAIGSVDCVQLLLNAGAEVNGIDKEGYTPLHMASGYLALPTVQILLGAGADPEQKDKEGRSPLELVESLREKIPNLPNLMTRRMALEQVARVLTENVFEDVPPTGVLVARAATDGTTREFLVRWGHGRDDEWVPQRYLADDVLLDFDAGLEYADAERVEEEREREGKREFLVQWRDGEEKSWEPAAHLSDDVLGEWEARKKGETYVPRTREQVEMVEALTLAGSGVTRPMANAT